MRSVELIDGFDFEEQSLVDQDIDAKCRIEPMPLELDVDLMLATDPVTHSRKLTRQHSLIDGFEQPLVPIPCAA